MIKAYFKPSDESIKKIKEAVNIYYTKGEEAYEKIQREILINIAKETGVKEVTERDLDDVRPAYEYWFKKFVSEFLEARYRYHLAEEAYNGVMNNDISKQEAE